MLFFFLKKKVIYEMSQTLDCEFVWKHFTTLCLHRAVGDPASRYSVSRFPEQIWGEKWEGEK